MLNETKSLHLLAEDSNRREWQKGTKKISLERPVESFNTMTKKALAWVAICLISLNGTPKAGPSKIILMVRQVCKRSGIP